MQRFALSPTADMNIDNLRIALFTYIISQQQQEDLIIRVEDTDQERNIEGKDQEILDLLALFGIHYSQVVYQSQNIRFHSAMALQLLHEKKAFSCFCSSAWLESKRQEAKDNNQTYSYDDACRNLPAELVIDNTNPFTVRVTKPEKTITIHDKIRGDISCKTGTIDSFVIMDQEKRPMYDFSSAVDDMLSDISMVICSEDHLNNTPKQIHIRESLAYDKELQYAHLPRILKSMDKTKENTLFNVTGLLKEGYLPEAIVNYLLSIGNKTPKEIFTLEEAKEWFTLDTLSDSPTHFDIKILQHINREHLKRMDAKELSRYVGFADAEIGELARIYLEEATTTKELKAKIAPIFSPRVIPEEFAQQISLMRETIKAAPYFDNYDDFKNYIIKESGLEGRNFLIPLYILLTNAEDGPEIAEVYKYLKNYIGEIIK